MRSFDTWVSTLKEKEHPILASGDVVSTSPDTPFGPIQFAKVTCEHYHAEIAKKGNAYIYHFFSIFPNFKEKLEQSLIDVFKNPEQLEMEFVPEMKSWAVRVNGFVNTLWGDDMAARVFTVLDELLAESSNE